MVDSKLEAENQELRRLLEEAESTLSAIRNGEVDALVIGGKEIYTLEGADHPYRVLVEAMQQGAVTLSGEGAIIYCNLGFAEMVRRPCEKIIGSPIESLFSSDDRLALLQGLAADSGVKQTELTLMPDDKSRLPVLVSFNFLHLDNVSAVCLVITDITEHKRNLQLQDSDRRKDEFLAMLAHELRNPLAPIANAAHILRLDKGATKEVQWASDVLDRQVQQLTRIVDDLLNISRITRGKIKLERTSINVSAIVTGAVETSRPLIEARKHKLIITLASESLIVKADLTRMAQVVTNLLNNAAKYTEEGGVIWLTVNRVADDVTITVRDNGVGIVPEMQPRVFDLFTQADRTIDRSQGGLGIGLTLVRSLVELHRGSVSVSSEGLGKGSQFVVRLPLFLTSDGSSTEDTPAEIIDSVTDLPQRILVVDDNLDSATSMALMLKTMGHELTVAHDGVQAIEIAESFKPNLILLDIGLPGMNGYAVAEKLRNNPELRGMVIAALTGYGEEQDRIRSEASGFDQHFVKPLTMVALRNLIETLPRR